MSTTKFSLDPDEPPIPLLTALLDDFLNIRYLNDSKDRTKFLWTEWERLYLPMLILADYANVEDVQLDDQGRVWVALSDSEEKIIPSPFGSSLRIQEFNYGDYGIDHPITQKDYVLMTSHGWRYFSQRTGYHGFRLRQDTLSKFSELIEEPEAGNISVFMFIGMIDHQYSTKPGSRWHGFEVGSKLRPYAEDAYYEDLLRTYLPSFEGDYTRVDLVTATNMRQSVIQNLHLKAQRQGRNIQQSESENFASRTNAYWWTAKGNELRSVDCLVRRGAITQETADRWI